LRNTWSSRFIHSQNYAMEAMKLSRGFRRLSVVAGFASSVLYGFLVLSWGGPSTWGAFVLALAVFVAVPVTFVLLLGWAIAGFQKSN